MQPRYLLSKQLLRRLLQLILATAAAAAAVAVDAFDAPLRRC